MNRTAQYGPIAGVGRRENAKRLDLNRDYMKLESAEARALAAAFTAWDPHLIVDLHTTNGSYHGYHLTQSIPLNLSLSPKILDYHRQTMMPAIMKSLEVEPQSAGVLLRQLRPRQRRAGRAAPLECVRLAAARRPELRRLPQPPDDPVRGAIRTSRSSAASRSPSSSSRRSSQYVDGHRAEIVALTTSLDDDWIKRAQGTARAAARRRVRVAAAAEAGARFSSARSSRRSTRATSVR